MSTTETDAEFVQKARNYYGPLTRKEMDRLFSIADHGVAMQWKPIEEAPKDGTVVLVYACVTQPEKLHESVRDLPPYIGLSAYHPDAGWCVCEIREVTHFMQVPAPQNQSEKSWMRLIALARRAVKLQAALTQAHALYGEQNDKG